MLAEGEPPRPRIGAQTFLFNHHQSLATILSKLNIHHNDGSDVLSSWPSASSNLITSLALTAVPSATETLATHTHAAPALSRRHPACNSLWSLRCTCQLGSGSVTSRSDPVHGWLPVPADSSQLPSPLPRNLSLPRPSRRNKSFRRTSLPPAHALDPFFHPFLLTAPYISLLSVAGHAQSQDVLSQDDPPCPVS